MAATAASSACASWPPQVRKAGAAAAAALLKSCHGDGLGRLRPLPADPGWVLLCSSHSVGCSGLPEPLLQAWRRRAYRKTRPPPTLCHSPNVSRDQNGSVQ